MRRELVEELADAALSICAPEGDRLHGDKEARHAFECLMKKFTQIIGTQPAAKGGEVKVTHEGKSTHRLATNPLEKAFADAWKEEAPRTLPKLLYAQDEHELTQAEATAVATVVQWLGSPVGSCFLEEVLNTDAASGLVHNLQRTNEKRHHSKR